MSRNSTQSAEVITVPVKVNDTLFIIDYAWRYTDDHGYIKYYDVFEYRVRSIAISCNSAGNWKMSFRVARVENGKVIDHMLNCDFDAIGKIAFVDKADADEILRENFIDLVEE